MNRRVQGLRSWLWQRISALYLGLFFLYALSALWMHAGGGYPAWRAWATASFNSILMFIFFLMLILHAWVGIRDVILDYVKPMGLRAVILLAVGFSLLMCLVWFFRILVVAILK